MMDLNVWLNLLLFLMACCYDQVKTGKIRTQKFDEHSLAYTYDEQGSRDYADSEPRESLKSVIENNITSQTIVTSSRTDVTPSSFSAVLSTNRKRHRLVTKSSAQHSSQMTTSSFRSRDVHKLKKCRVPGRPNGILKLQNGTEVKPTMKVVNGTEITLTCESDYTMTSRISKSTCKSNGKWTKTLASCSNSSGRADRAVLIGDRATYDECGYCKDCQPSKIYGGTYTSPGEFPWMAYLEIFNGGSSRPNFCGGSLINKQWVLTAAHCLTGSEEGPQRVNVRLGRHNISLTEQTEQMLPMERFVIHPEYDPDNAENYDFALIKLKTAATVTAKVRTICLPNADTLCDDESGRSPTASIIDGCSNVTAAGWGSTEDYRPTSQALKKVSLKLFSKNDCKRANQRPNVVITEAQMCAGNRTAKQDTCIGDSGGPLMCISNYKYYVIGLVSYSYYLDCGLAGIPAVYSRVCKVRGWIRDTTSVSLAPTTTKRITTTTTPEPTTELTTEEMMECEIPYELVNARVYIDGRVALPSSRYPAGTMVDVRCSTTAFQFADNRASGASWCSDSGNWDPPLAKCIAKPKPCGTVPKVVNGTVGPGSSQNGARRDVTCVSSYIINGASSIICNNGTWSAPGRCVPPPKPCSAVPSITNGYVDDGDSASGAMRDVFCNNGYFVNGSATITCTNGRWSTPGRCVPRPCGTVPSVAHGYVSTGNSQSGATRNISCLSGYILSGSATIACRLGEWSSPGMCRLITTTTRRTTTTTKKKPGNGNAYGYGNGNGNGNGYGNGKNFDGADINDALNDTEKTN